jgi:hypothetical protein
VYRGSPSSRPLSTAERRHPRAGTGTGYRGYGYYPSYPYYPYYYAPGWGYWYSPGYYPSYYYGYYPYWGAGFSYGVGGAYFSGSYSGGGSSGGHASDAAAVRILVEPDDAKVYVDGYYAGEVNQFDGMSQRLHLAPGRHEILLKKDGYRTHRIKLYVEANTSVKLRYDMEKGLGPDTLDDQAGDRGLDEERRPVEPGVDDAPAREPEDAPAQLQPAPSPEGTRSPGLLALRVTPEDASVYVDGRFFGSARQVGEIELGPGPHRLEIVRPGFRTLERDVHVEPGRTLTLGIALERP